MGLKALLPIVASALVAVFGPWPSLRKSAGLAAGGPTLAFVGGDR